MASSPIFNGTHRCYYRCLNCSLVCIPLPPPLPLPPPPHFNQFKSHLIITLAVLLSVFLLVIVCWFIIKCSSNGNTSRRRFTATRDNTHVDQDQTWIPVDYLQQRARTSGVESSEINSITVFKFKRGDGLIEGTECSVCLNEFRNDEKLRLLPNCTHAFHIPCIDTWLKSHVSCPLCRVDVISNSVT